MDNYKEEEEKSSTTEEEEEKSVPTKKSKSVFPETEVSDFEKKCHQQKYRRKKANGKTTWDIKHCCTSYENKAKDI